MPTFLFTYRAKTQLTHRESAPDEVTAEMQFRKYFTPEDGLEILSVTELKPYSEKD